MVGRAGMCRAVMCTLALLLAAAPIAHASGATEGAELLGTRPPAWSFTAWIGSPPLTLDELRGRVVLVRWWTGPDCPLCHASAPSLNELHEQLADRGLVVLGIYHHKSRAPLSTDAVRRMARSMGFEFPVAIDPEWRTLQSWWLSGAPRSFTSVTFVLDREGVIRYIHPGGKYELGGADYAALRAQVESLLAAPRPGG